jgi:hypothetical protein
VCPAPHQAIIVEPEETAGARLRLRKHVIAATNIHATVEELLDAVFSMRSVSCQIVVKGIPIEGLSPRRGERA